MRGQDYADAERRYRTIDKPTLLLWGREDIVTPLATASASRAICRTSKLVVYPRCGHFPMIEALAASTRDLVQFLAEGRRAA